jgi:hypothetical protein
MELEISRGLSRADNNTGMNSRETGWDCVNWMHLAQGGGQWWTLMNTVMNFWVP